jgi:predicted dehydrogenase
MTIRWGIIGTGDISSRLVPDLLTVDGCSVTAVWGRAQEGADSFAAEHDIPFATDQRARLLERGDVDVVYIATPAHTHREIALEALEAGKHVLVEKPMAMSAPDVEAIFAKAREVGKFAMEAMWMRFNPLHVEVIERIRAGLLGDVRSVRASFGTPFRASPTRLRPADGGSILLDRGIYAVTLAHWAMGRPDSVNASGVVDGAVDIAGHATLDYSEGRFAHAAWSGVEFLDLSAAISGDHGWVTLDPMFWAGSTARIHAGSAERIFSSPEILNHPRQGNGYVPMLGAVRDALRDGLWEHPWHDRTSTVEVAQTLDAIRELVDNNSLETTRDSI